MINYIKTVGQQLKQLFSQARVVWSIVLVLAIFAITYTTIGLITVNNKIKILNETYTNGSPTEGNELPRIFTLRKDNAFLESRLMLAKSDSMTLSINLEDSLLCLEFQGVVVHQTKILNFHVSGVFKSLKPDPLLNLIATPLEIESQVANTHKEPIREIKAPKDTTEVATAKHDSTNIAKEEQVYYTLTLKNGIEINLMSKHESKLEYLPYYLSKKFELLEKNTKTLVHFSMPEYQPYIRIEVEENEAKTIYRALPQNGLVALKI